MDKLLSFTPEPFPELDREAEYDEIDPLAGEWEAEEAEEEVRRGRRPRLSAKAPRRSVSKPTVRPRIQGRATGPRVKPFRQPPKLIQRPFPVPALRPVPIPFIPPQWGLRPDLEPALPRDTQRPEESRRPEQAGSEGSGGPPTAQPSEEPASEHVRWVQDCLNRALGLQLTVDGVLGRATRSAVRLFQERRGLLVTGMIGPDTEAALQATCSTVTEPPAESEQLLEANRARAHPASCTCPSCTETATMNHQLSFEAEPFAANTKSQEFETPGLETLDLWHGVAGQGSPERVRSLQKSLNKSLGLQLKVDGIMGPKTRSAIRSFRKKAGRTVDGGSGLELDRDISYSCVAEQEYSPQPTLRRGSRGPAVVELQQRLTAAGFPLQADGIFGPKTYQAVVAYQSNRGLTVDGVVGPQTWAALQGGAGPGGLPVTCNPYQAAFEQAAQYVGVPVSWASNSALCQLVKHESRWDPSADNPNSTAFGLFQFLKSTWGTHLPEVPYGTTDPYWQAVGGFRYIQAAYRTPERAWAFWQATVRKNAALAPPDLRRKAENWISHGWGGYELSLPNLYPESLPKPLNSPPEQLEEVLWKAGASSKSTASHNCRPGEGPPASLPDPEGKGSHPLVYRGETQRRSRNPTVGHAQMLLNRFLEGISNSTFTCNQGADMAKIATLRRSLTQDPLMVDCRFGANTEKATLMFQRCVFPGDPRQWDGKIGPSTWNELKKLGRGAVRSDKEIIDAALAGSQIVLSHALSALKSIEGAYASGLLNIPEIKRIHQQTLDALQDRLKVTPGHSYFLRSIQVAQKLIAGNLSLQRTHQEKVRRSPKDCTDWAVTYGRDPANGVNLCGIWFDACFECRRDVIIHEFFHLRPLNLDDLYKKKNRELMSPEESLRDTNEMAQLVSHIATGLTDACEKYRLRCPCDKLMSQC